MEGNIIKENENNIILNIDKNSNDSSFQRLAKLQKLIKKESALREICKNTINFIFSYYNKK